MKRAVQSCILEGDIGKRKGRKSWTISEYCLPIWITCIPLKGGINRIRRNLKLDTADVVAYCKHIILEENCRISRKSKNWYCETDHIKITVNSSSYTIITAHCID